MFLARSSRTFMFVLFLFILSLVLPDYFISAESETLPRIYISTTSTKKESQGCFFINVTLTPASSRAVSIDYQTVSESAVSDVDYAGKLGTITWKPGQTGKSIIVEILNDQIVEDDETFSLVFSNPQNALFSGSTSKQFTIQDNDHSLSLNYTGSGKGTVHLNPPGGSYEEGTIVDLTAEPVTSCDFTEWGVDVSGNELLAAIAMNSDKTVTAEFSLKTFDVTVAESLNGTITGEAEGIEYGQSTILHIAAAPNYHIASVSKDGMDITPQEETFSMDVTFSEITEEGHALQAAFAIDTYQILMDPGKHGSITGDAAVNWGTDHAYDIVPDTGYEIMDVILDGTSQGAISTIELDNVAHSHTISASFRMDSQMVEWAGLGEFNIAYPDEAPVVDEGTCVILPEELDLESMAPILEDLVDSINIVPVVSSDVNVNIQNREQGEEFLQGISFDIIFDSADIETGLLPLRIGMEISRDQLGCEYCDLIDMGMEDNDPAFSFLDYVGILKVISPDTYDLLEVAWERHPEAEARSFFEVSADQSSYHIGFDLLVADAEMSSSDLVVQAVWDSSDRYFVIFDGKRDGHFSDPLLAVRKPFPEVKDEGRFGCDAVMPLPGLIILILPLLALLAKK